MALFQEAEKQRQDVVKKMLKDCKNLPICRTTWAKNVTCEGWICAMVGKKEECAESVADMDSWFTCKKLGTTERCEFERKSKVCLKKSPKLCVTVIEDMQKNCTEKEGNERLCKMKRNKTAKMGTEEVCKESQEQWQECSVEHDFVMHEMCKRSCWVLKDRETLEKCEKGCTIEAEECECSTIEAEECTNEPQEKETLKRIKVLVMRHLRTRT